MLKLTSFSQLDTFDFIHHFKNLGCEEVKVKITENS